MAEGYGTPGSIAICPSLGESSSAPVGVSLLYAYMVLHEYNIFCYDVGCQGEGKYTHRLVKIDRPVLRIPTLCIHLRTQEEREAFKVNKEDHLMPILSAEIKKALLPATNTSDSEPTPDPNHAWRSSQEPNLLTLLAEVRP